MFPDGLQVSEAAPYAALASPGCWPQQGASMHQRDGQECRSPALSLLSVTVEELRLILSL